MDQKNKALVLFKEWGLDVSTSIMLWGMVVARWQGMKQRTQGKCPPKNSIHLYEGLELCDKLAFYDWTLARSDFKEVVLGWRRNSFRMKFSPSIDRIDSKKGYFFENMRWLPWGKHCQISGMTGKKRTRRFKGINPDLRSGRTLKWNVAIKRDGKLIHLGRYADEEQAARVYDRWARTLHGKDAKLNFPD